MKKNILTKTIFATFLLFFFSFGFTFAEDVAVLLNKDGQPVSKLNYSNSFFSKIRLNILCGYKSVFESNTCVVKDTSTTNPVSFRVTKNTNSGAVSNSNTNINNNAVSASSTNAPSSNFSQVFSQVPQIIYQVIERAVPGPQGPVGKDGRDGKDANAPVANTPIYSFNGAAQFNGFVSQSQNVVSNGGPAALTTLTAENSQLQTATVTNLFVDNLSGSSLNFGAISVGSSFASTTYTTTLFATTTNSSTTNTYGLTTTGNLY